MKIILILIFLIIFVNIFAIDYTELYYKGNEKALNSIYDSLTSKGSKISDTLIFYVAEVSTDPGKSITLYRKIIDKYTKSSFYLPSKYRMAKYYLLKDDSLNALELLKQLIYEKHNLYSPLAYISIIGYYERTGNQEMAKKYINEFTLSFKNNPFLKNYNIGINTHTKDLEKYYTIQIGAFSKKANAEQTMNKFILKGYKAYIFREKEIYKVRIGKFKTKNEADAFLRILQKAEGVSAWIVKVN